MWVLSGPTPYLKGTAGLVSSPSVQASRLPRGQGQIWALLLSVSVFSLVSGLCSALKNTYIFVLFYLDF